MQIQSLSVCVPAGCPNQCKFCVAAMNRGPNNTYEDRIGEGMGKGINSVSSAGSWCRYERDYVRRLAFARDNGCNTLMYTSSGEALMNLGYMERVAKMNRGLASPFRWIELQTSGVLMDDDKYLRSLRDYVDISTISISLSSMSSEINAEINGIPERLQFCIDTLCRRIKEYGFNLRLSLNMSSVYNGLPPEAIFTRAGEMGADQITFRKLYLSDDHKGSAQAKWIAAHPYVRYVPSGASEGIDAAQQQWEHLVANPGGPTVDERMDYQRDGMRDIEEYVREEGTPLEVLPFGAMRYSVHGVSTVIDLDCMSKGPRNDGALKYLVLRPDCRLYTRWDDKGSLLF